MRLAGTLGLSHNNNRDIYHTLGYPLKIQSKDLLVQWRRQDIARAVVDRPVSSTWKGKVVITEPDSEKEADTELEKAWLELDKKLKLKHNLMRVDRLAQLGGYACLLLGFDDVSNRNDWKNPVERGSGRKLVYVRPIRQEHAPVDKYENDPTNERFGKPKLYKITTAEPESQTNTEKIQDLHVHHTRILHVAFNLVDNEIEGVPILETLYNRLKDMEKLVGGSAEMFWRGARPGFAASTQKDYVVDTNVEKDFQKQLDEYENNLRRFLLVQGMDINPLNTQVSDPKNHVEVQMQMISALTGIPLRILTGSERGELASSQDAQTWKKFVDTRRTEEVEPAILSPLVMTLMDLGVLPELEEDKFTFQWEELFGEGEKEKAEVGKIRATAISEYLKHPMAEAIISFEAFMKYILGMDEDTVADILSMQDDELRDMLREEQELEEEEEIEEVPET